MKDLFFESFDVDNINSLTIPGSVKSITPFAFEMLKSLKKATLSEGVEEIETGAFSGCISLETVCLPKSLIKIGNQAFLDCISLEKIYYSGTEEEWLALYKGEGWDENAEKLNVICCLHNEKEVE